MILRPLTVLVPLYVVFTRLQAIRRGWQARQGELSQPQPAPEVLPPAWSSCRPETKTVPSNATLPPCGASSTRA